MYVHIYSKKFTCNLVKHLVNVSVFKTYIEYTCSYKFKVSMGFRTTKDAKASADNKMFQRVPRSSQISFSQYETRLNNLSVNRLLID